MSAYAELEVTSNYSFLHGASHPEELMVAAKTLGLAALGLADRNSLAGAVRGHVAAKAAGLDYLVGARLISEDGPEILCYPRDRAAYGRLCRLLTLGRRRAPKGECHLGFADILEQGEGCELIMLPDGGPGAGPDGGSARRFDSAALQTALEKMASAFPGHVWLAARWRFRGDDARRIEALAALARRCRVPLLATGDVAMHHPGRKAMLDLVTCIREGCTIDDAGFRLEANGERHLKAPAVMAELFRDYPQALEASLEVAGRCDFSLDELRYEYPEELGCPGESPQQTLARLTWAGARQRYPGGPPAKVEAALKHELQLIEELDFAPYFLTVEDTVRFARENGILCQGRGSAANSAVCYCLGITAVDPANGSICCSSVSSAAERNEPPDIDVDFEHERREEVIQYIYNKYGRDRAGLTATVICYRGRGAIRDAGKAMGLSADTITALAGSIWGWSGEGVDEEVFTELGLDPRERRLAQTLALTRELIGFPRHLSQHVGGFVMTRGPLCELVPIENAAMEDRTVIEWDKDDLDALGILKVDVLALGMLTCLKKGFRPLDRPLRSKGMHHDLASVPDRPTTRRSTTCSAGPIPSASSRSKAGPR